VEQGVHTRPMSKDDQDDLLPVEGIDSSPGGYAQGPDILVTRQLVNVQFGRRRPRMLGEELERLVEPALRSTGKSVEALPGDRVGELQPVHSARPRKPMSPAEALQRLPRKEQYALHVATEVVGGDLIHEVLNGLRRTLPSDLVVAQSSADMLRQGDGCHALFGGGHGPDISSIGLIGYAAAESPRALGLGREVPVRGSRIEGIPLLEVRHGIWTAGEFEYSVKPR
jgi:hypothetical protein